MCDEPADEEMDEPSATKRPSVLTIDRAAFLLLRVKRAFKKKRQQRKDKHAAAAAAAAAEALGGGRRGPRPLLRSRTLPAIIAPGFTILQAQIDPQRCSDLTQSQLLCRGVSAHKVCGLRAHAPRISFTGKEEAETHDQRRKSASSRLGTSPRSSIASEERVDGIALRVPTPRGSVSSTGSSTGSRLARLLTQGVRCSGAPEDVANDAPRRLSWERRESSGQLPRSASIDSMVEAVICARHSEPSQSSLQLPRADRALSLVSPAVGRRAKTQRGQAGSNTDRDPGPSSQHVAHAGSPTRGRTSSTRDRAPTPEPSTSNAPDTAAKTADPVEDKEIDLDEDLLVLLGEAPEPETSFGKAVHKDISTRWLDILKKGLSKEVKEKLAKEYLIPSNCESLVPPILNPEAKAALTETFVKRDSSLLYRQKQTSVAISALAQAIDVIISCKDQELKQKILKPVNDACRILCDMHQAETKRRRKFVISSINTVMKDTLTNSNTDKYLFGNNMSEKLKTAKNVQKSGEALKVPQKTAFQKSNFYKNSNSKNRTNFKLLHRQTAGRPDAGRTAPATRYQNNSSSASAPSRAPDRARERSPLLPPPRRSARR